MRRARHCGQSKARSAEASLVPLKKMPTGAALGCRQRGNGFPVSRGRETRRHPPTQIRKLQASIEQFGFVLPIVIDAASRVIAGWGLAVAAKRLGLPEVPAVTIADLDEAQLRMLRLALNRLSEDSRWDAEALRWSSRTSVLRF